MDITTETKQHLSFNLGGEVFAVDIEKIRELYRKRDFV